MMADREYMYTPPTVVNAVGGDPRTGTKWGEGFVRSEAEKLNAVFAQIAGDINFLLSRIGATRADTLVYSWASHDAIIVHPGLAIAADGTQYRVANDVTLTLDADLDTGERQADSIYFVWIGEDTVTGDTRLKLSLSDDTPPVSFVAESAYRLRYFFNTNPGNANIEPFCAPLPDDWPAGLYFWDAPIKPAGCHWAHGQVVSRTHAAYARLYAKYGEVWGAGDGSHTFGLPDMRGRSPMGAGKGIGLANRLFADYLGAERVALTTAELPSHNHNIPSHTHIGGAHTHIGGVHAHTGGAHTHTGEAHTHTGGAHTHTGGLHAHIGGAHAHGTTISTRAGGSSSNPRGGDGGAPNVNTSAGGAVATSAAGNVPTSAGGTVATSSGGTVATGSGGNVPTSAGGNVPTTKNGAVATSAAGDVPTSETGTKQTLARGNNLSHANVHPVLVGQYLLKG